MAEHDTQTLVRLHRQTRDDLIEYATNNGTTATEILRGIIAGYAEHGSDAGAPNPVVAFSVRIGSEVRDSASIRAAKEGKSLNQVVRAELEELLYR